MVKVARPLSQVHIPTTVQGVLACRVDRLLPDEKQLLQTLAVIGREFPLPLVQRVAQVFEEALDEMLSHLQNADFINEEPAFPDIRYNFKHALTQEVAYNSLLTERRQLIHQQIAEAMEACYGNGSAIFLRIWRCTTAAAGRRSRPSNTYGSQGAGSFALILRRRNHSTRNGAGPFVEAGRCCGARRAGTRNPNSTVDAVDCRERNGSSCKSTKCLASASIM
jgi:hypothetical protein